jgi:glycosyltransferase involved in cell wall biosynthesis
MHAPPRMAPADGRKPSVTLFLPAWNEADALPRIVTAAHAYLSDATRRFSIVVIDDGSTDDTVAVTHGLCAQLPEVSSIRHDVNRGYGAALRTGFRAALDIGDDWIGYCDADGQFDPADVGALIAAAQAQDAVIAIGYRVHRADNLVRRLMGRGWHAVSRVALGVEARDVDCGFKVFRHEALSRLEPRLFGDFATISPEILARAAQAQMPIVEVGLSHAPRDTGRSSGANLHVVVGSFRALARLRRSLREDEALAPIEIPAVTETIRPPHEEYA